MTFLATLCLTAAPSTHTTVSNDPVDFRCDGMHVDTQPRRMVCRGNVVAQQKGLLICCEEFVGYAKADGSWTHFVCSKDVRAQRNDEQIWSEQATFDLDSGKLFLTGSPKVRRGKSVLSGDRVIVETKRDRVNIDKPRGQVVSNAAPVQVQVIPEGAELPAICPLPPLTSSP
ncbi:MAG: LptA/OstA family protein [Myxococcota bacterium]